ncbi:MAG: hypothetical protein M3Y71_07400, partial [Actinomycetota bacterium]|nr:hypothetical protein [Actinomycetota bacterium]
MPQPEDAPWVRLSMVSEIAEECALRVEHAGVPVCLARSQGRLQAIIDRMQPPERPPCPRVALG